MGKIRGFHDLKSGSARSAAYGLLEKAYAFSSCDAYAAEASLVERSNRDKGNTESDSDSDSMLTYRRAESKVH